MVGGMEHDDQDVLKKMTVWLETKVLTSVTFRLTPVVSGMQLFSGLPSTSSPSTGVSKNLASHSGFSEVRYCRRTHQQRRKKDETELHESPNFSLPCLA
jgi:hypothetical protein